MHGLHCKAALQHVTRQVDFELVDEVVLHVGEVELLRPARHVTSHELSQQAGGVEVRRM